MKLWSGRFQKETDALVNDFNSSIGFDSRMYAEDIAGSIAHATMLGECGIISPEDQALIVQGLSDILADIEAGKVEFTADNEDIHTLEDLSGRTTANSPSSTYADMALEYGAEVTYVSTLTDTVQMLEQGRVEATINAQGSIRDYMEQHPDAGIKVVQVIEGDPVAFPMQKNEDAASLVEAVNAALEKMRADGTLGELSVKYFGVDLTEKN